MLTPATFILILLVFLSLKWIDHIHAKIYERCEFVQELVQRHQVSVQEAGVWACIADKQSNYNTAALGGGQRSHTKYHGIFQISDEYWCSPPGKGWVCGKNCQNFRDDDLTDDLNCVRQHIHQEHEVLSGDGFNAWPIYKQYCKANAQRYVIGCDLNAKVSSYYKPQKKPTISGVTKPNTYLGGGKIYEPCELANELLYKHNLPANEIATWVCIAKHESRYNTSAIGYGDHGLFQISEIYWCGRKGRAKACNLACSDLIDGDITDDVQCLKQIFEEHTRLRGNGFTAWTVYNRHCKGDVSSYVQNCFQSQGNLNQALHAKPQIAQTSTSRPFSTRTTRSRILTTYKQWQQRPTNYHFQTNQRKTSQSSKTATPYPSSSNNLIEYYLKFFNNKNNVNSIR